MQTTCAGPPDADIGRVELNQLIGRQRIVTTRFVYVGCLINLAVRRSCQYLSVEDEMCFCSVLTRARVRRGRGQVDELAADREGYFQIHCQTWGTGVPRYGAMACVAMACTVRTVWLWIFRCRFVRGEVVGLQIGARFEMDVAISYTRVGVSSARQPASPKKPERAVDSNVQYRAVPLKSSHLSPVSTSLSLSFHSRVRILVIG